MITIQSPNFTHVKQRNITHIILHHTHMHSCQAAIERLCNPKAVVSAHYVIDKHSGIVTQLVPDNLIAHHAGQSFWQGKDAINNFSIGIELDNNGIESFSLPLMESLLTLLKELRLKYKILPINILGHLDIAPWRKLDPHHKFDWQLLNQHGFGLWPNLQSDDFTICTEDPKLKLEQLGFDTRDIKATIQAFNTHFNPLTYTKNCVDVWVNSSNIYLNNLLEQMQDDPAD